MEDIQLITYIIFAVLYLIFKVMQKKKDPNQDQGEIDAGQQQQRPKKPAMSFEEMLREFTGENQDEAVEEERPRARPVAPRPVAPVKEPEPEKKYFSYETDYDEQAQKTYQQSIEQGRRAFTLDEQVNIEDVNTKVGNVQLAEDRREDQAFTGNSYLDAFRTIDGAKKAFIYSEIFKRKYF